MLKKSLPIGFLAMTMCLPAAAPLGASDDPPEKVIVLSDSGDVDTDNDSVFGDDDAGQTVVRIERDGHRGYLGVRLIEMTPELREHFGAPRDAGVFIGAVEKDSPAAKAGLQVGDIVTAADGARVDSTRDLSRAVRRKKEGDSVKLDLSRDRVKKQVTIAVGKAPEHELRVGDLGPMIQKEIRIHGPKDWENFRVMPLPQDTDRFQEKLDQLEKRLNDLEKRLPSK
ncbi:MAG TPA: PDZ domain-containing protein [Thermoanaerobaculia bacterium]|nr:PDZ domain-containing protein [Thermoanaerobaculia bacterium]